MAHFEVEFKKLHRLFQEESLVFLGVVPLLEEESFFYYRSWIEKKRHADMSFLETHLSIRQNPAQIFSGATSSIVYALPYYQGDSYQGLLNQKEPIVAQYARQNDYHKILKEKGARVLGKLFKHDKEKVYSKIFVDSAPILERALALKTRKGIIGKNGFFIHPQYGTYLLLGEIVTSATIILRSAEGMADLMEESCRMDCGSCKSCLSSCPTKAIDMNGHIESKKCLSYLTIENKMVIPECYWELLRYYYFGCDICQLVCKFNFNIDSVGKNGWWYRDDCPTLFDVACMDQRSYESYFGGTPLVRAKRHGLRRNALIALRVKEDSRWQQAINSVKNDDPKVLHDTVKQLRDWKPKEKPL